MYDLIGRFFNRLKMIQRLALSCRFSGLIGSPWQQ